MNEVYEIAGQTVSRYQYRLFDAMDKLHCIATGASDALPENECKVYLKFLEARLAYWHKNAKRNAISCEYEDLVKALLEVLIKEFKQWVGVYTPWQWGED